MVDNRTGDIHGTSIQAGVIHGSLTVNTHLPGAPVPGWVEVAMPVPRYGAGELGVHGCLPGSEGVGLPAYVVRDVDSELDQRLSAAAASPRGGLVLVAGASTAGKTRSLVAAVGRTLPERMLVAPPEDADLRPLPGWLAARAERAPQGWVVWLDDLDRHLSASGLTPALIAELGVAGGVVAATIRSHQLEALRPSVTDGDASAPVGVGYAVLKSLPVVVERRWNTQERERARASEDERVVQAASDERFGVAEQLAAGPVLEPIWLGGPDSGHPRGYALVAAAVGLAQAGVASPLTREQIYAAHTAYLPDPPPLPEEVDRAWAWAIRQRSGLAGLLVPADHEGRWRAFDYLTPQGHVPDAVWRTALDTASEQDRIAVGVTARSFEQDDIAEEAFRPLARRGHLDAMFYYAFQLSLRPGQGWVWEAIELYERAAGRGHVEAMFEVAELYAIELPGQELIAEYWYSDAIDHGHSEAVYGLAELLAEERGREGEAESWYRKALEQGDKDAMTGLGRLLGKVGRKKEALDWWRRAAEQGDTHAMYVLTEVLAEEPGREKAAGD
ncbi:tetratricopeptide repeat protein [Nocardiopsis metallicus]|uniref:Sel1 repeat family protein n=1 Tax=Nocardiopsis metallicus TaxID=179819 RepID=A0A840W392_9ACTN|nr:tetratricopeptide repeat protein [Nocardiopsis metallicus]MBB5490444.1 hypothetical protein [Nocardiopsis metallicus]